MRLLADENVPRVAVAALRDAGHDVRWIREESPGVGDPTVLEKARDDGRTLLTFDKDFARMVFHKGGRNPSGVLLFRLRLASPEYVAGRVVAAVEFRQSWDGVFATVRDDEIVIRAMP